MSITLVPTIVFKVNLSRLSEEKMGPCTNQNDVTLLPPDQYCNAGNVDAARTATTVRDAQKVALLSVSGLEFQNNDYATAYGQKAIYLRDNFSDQSATAVANDRAWLTVYSVDGVLA
jgi:hypothetical protein